MAARAPTTTPSPPQNPGYGYWWWLSRASPTLDSTDFSELPGGSLHPFGPDDSYCAVGLGSQFIEVIPEHDMVVVRMGLAPQDNPVLWAQPLPLELYLRSEVDTTTGELTLERKG